MSLNLLPLSVNIWLRIYTPEIRRYLRFRKKLQVLNYARDIGSVRKTCETFGISKRSFYNWKNKYDKYGEEGLIRKTRDYKSYGNRINDEVIELILKLRKENQMGTWRIKWYLERYHDIKVSESSVYRTLKDLKMLKKKWEDFYNFNRPHGAFNGKTPYETMFSLLKN